MLDVEFIRNEPDKVRSGLKSKNADPKSVEVFLELDEKWRLQKKAFDDLRSEPKKLGPEGKEKGAELKVQLKKMEADLMELEKMRLETLLQMPNLPLEKVLIGKDESFNKVIREVGVKPSLPNPKDYLTLATNLGIIDMERAAKVSGSRFSYLKGAAVLLEFALVDLAIKTLKEDGFIPVSVPVLINKKSMQGMGYMERGQDEIYRLANDDLYLIGTSEQALGPMHQDEVFEEKDLPKRYIGISPCFRKEAGSYGKDTKGILRVHQFDKVEMFSIVTSENSESEHQLLLSLQEKLMQKLEIPYRVLNMCSGDLGDPAAAKYDIEAWLPGQNNGKGEYRETHSTSNTTDFQSRRLNIKYRPSSQTSHPASQFVHMLNGTAFAIGRTIIAILENYQTEKGTIKVPNALQQYLGSTEITG